MSKRLVYRSAVIGAVGLVIAAAFLFGLRVAPEGNRVATPTVDAAAGEVTLTIRYPLDETLFPPEIAAPTFVWQSSPAERLSWQVELAFQDGQEGLICPASETGWTPADGDWEAIKQRSVEHPATVTIRGYREASPEQAVCEEKVRISTAAAEVGAPLFFREVNVPFRVAVKDPAAYIRWRFGPVSSKGPPPIVMEKLPVCGNCHSFSADGRTLALEVDSGNDKGSYAIAAVKENMVLGPKNIITWSDFRREDNQKTFGLLCQASPDGRYVVGTVKDRALAVYRDELAFSQLFFPVKGMMAIYDRQEDSFSLLPGADDPAYVQTNGTWSPDGKTIVFSRSHEKAHDPPSLRTIESLLVPRQEAAEFLSGERTFPFDLYRIPFNEGKGGKAEPIPGASNNGMSNYFAKFSPDGKWIVFCRARSFMLLQPDSELYIIPAEGGEARRLRCNTSRMNSWHSWSPNGRWLVFSSKTFSDYTQLFLTHIDEEGNSTPAVQLKDFTVENRAANIPEFVNAPADAIAQIKVDFLDDTHFYRAAGEFRQQGDVENAIRLCRQALEVNPNHAGAHAALGYDLNRTGKKEEAETHLRRAVELDPDDWQSHEGLGVLLAERGELKEATQHFREVVRIEPTNPAGFFRLGVALIDLGREAEAKVPLAEVARLNPLDAKAAFCLGTAHFRCGEVAEAVSWYRRTLEIDPAAKMAMVALASILATSNDPNLRNGTEAVKLASRACEASGFPDPQTLHVMAASCAETGRMNEAVAFAKAALEAAQAAGNRPLAEAIGQSLLLFQQGKPLRSG
ncbi:MAG: tetratricopeptide repeat protein [Planctomycetaceae bacterium]|nr:tetratricopeptide repeat protein [Planctomycetaceae bacterium]